MEETPTADTRRLRGSNRNSFMILGILEAAWAPMIPFVKERFMLDEGQLGLLLLTSGLGAVLTMPFSGWLVSRFGPKLSVKVSGVIMSLALMGLALSPWLPLTVALLLFFGSTTVMLDVGSNVNAVIVENTLKRPLLSGFHGGYSLGTLFGAGLLAFLLTTGLGLNASAAALMILGLLVVLFGCNGLLTDIRKFEAEEKKEDAAEGAAGKKRFSIPPTIEVIGILCFIMYSSEGAVLSWSAVFAHEERGMDLESAGFIYTAFAITMTTMRFLGNTLVAKAGRRRVVFVGGLCVGIGFTLTLIPSLIAAIAGFALVGLGAANVVPQMVSFAGRVRGISVHAAVTFINAVGYSGILLGPVLIGLVAKHLSISAAFLGIACLCLAAAFTNWHIMRPGNPALRSE
ncbi:MAG: MFS transporter [Succinivibrio sp.]|nr:MFS transporter [Succinivibrio sp.]